MKTEGPNSLNKEQLEAIQNKKIIIYNIEEAEKMTETIADTIFTLKRNTKTEILHKSSLNLEEAIHYEPSLVSENNSLYKEVIIKSEVPIFSKKNFESSIAKEITKERNNNKNRKNII